MVTIGGAGSYVPSAIEQARPDLDLTDPEPVTARRALRTLLDDGPLDELELEGLVGAVSEVVTNAQHYGEPPVRMLVWVDERHAVVAVSDCGDGPDDPDAGMKPAEREVGDGGLGLWLARQMCHQVVMGRHPDGFTIRLVAGKP